MGSWVALHVLAAVVWVGGMFFAYLVLRPVAASQLEPPQRLLLWQGVFSIFFRWVWGAVALLWLSGFGIVYTVFGSLSYVGPHVHLMMSVGLLMTLIFAGIYWSPWRKLSAAVDAKQWPVAGSALNRIRQLVALNLGLGILVVVVGSSGRYFV